MKEKTDKVIQNHIETKADEFLYRLRKEKRVEVPKMQKQLKISDEVMEKWIIIFEDRGLLERIYPANPLKAQYIVIKDGK